MLPLDSWYLKLGYNHQNDNSYVFQGWVNRKNINFMVAILKFKMAAPHYVKILTSCIFGFLDPENIGVDTKIGSLRASRAEIRSKVVNLAAILKSALYRKS